VTSELRDISLKGGPKTRPGRVGSETQDCRGR
jgi:hypothetical protein